MANIGHLKAELNQLGLHFLSVGHFVPGEPITNEHMAETVDTSDEWIVSRTGIQERHFCAEGENNIDLAGRAAEEAISRAGISPEQIGVALVATFTPDHMSPSMACMLRDRLGLPEDTFVYDLNAACAGFLFALQTARQMLLASERPYALIVGSEAISPVLDFADRSTCVLFGDGAGAAVVELSEEHCWHWLGGSRGDTGRFLYCSGTADRRQGEPKNAVHMQGQEVFRFAVEIIPQCVERLLAESGLKMTDIDYVVCHQANIRIISHVVKKMKAEPEKFFVNLQKYGNTSSASIPLALNDMWEQDMLKPGQKIICVGFGAGFTWSACLLEW
jgi:3-oxoacyl-[acyl-carrier-protein] synthase-3